MHFGMQPKVYVNGQPYFLSAREKENDSFQQMGTSVTSFLKHAGSRFPLHHKGFPRHWPPTEILLLLLMLKEKEFHFLLYPVLLVLSPSQTTSFVVFLTFPSQSHSSALNHAQCLPSLILLCELADFPSSNRFGHLCNQQPSVDLAFPFHHICNGLLT